MRRARDRERAYEKTEVAYATSASPKNRSRIQWSRTSFATFRVEKLACVTRVSPSASNTRTYHHFAHFTTLIFLIALLSSLLMM